MRRSRKRDHLTVEKGDAAMTRPSPAPRNRRRPTPKPILTTIEFCASCHKRLRPKRKDNALIAAGTMCPICDKALCPMCAKKARVFDEESAFVKHIREDEQVARNHAFDHLLYEIYDRDNTYAAIDRQVDERVAVMCRAARPVESMKRMLSLSRMGRDISPLAYAQDQMTMARLLLLHLRGEFDAPNVVLTLTSAHSLADDAVAPPATMKRTVKFYVTPTDPGFPPPKDKDTWV